MSESRQPDRDDLAAMQILFHGEEGSAVYNPREDRIAMSLDLGQGRLGALLLYPDGTIRCLGGGATTVGTIHISWPTQRDLSPMEAETYNAFHRSKGVTLPHVMP